MNEEGANKTSRKSGAARWLRRTVGKPELKDHGAAVIEMMREAPKDRPLTDEEVGHVEEFMKRANRVIEGDPRKNRKKRARDLLEAVHAFLQEDQRQRRLFAEQSARNEWWQERMDRAMRDGKLKRWGGKEEEGKNVRMGAFGGFYVMDLTEDKRNDPELAERSSQKVKKLTGFVRGVEGGLPDKVLIKFDAQSLLPLMERLTIIPKANEAIREEFAVMRHLQDSDAGVSRAFAIVRKSVSDDIGVPKAEGIVMELIPNARPFSADDAAVNLSDADQLDLAASAFRGLARIHMAGVAAQDIKPENVLVSSSTSPPRVAFIDFGLSCGTWRGVTADWDDCREKKGGSPFFIPPDDPIRKKGYKGEEEQTFETAEERDVWSLAQTVVLGLGFARELKDLPNNSGPDLWDSLLKAFNSATRNVSPAEAKAAAAREFVQSFRTPLSEELARVLWQDAFVPRQSRKPAAVIADRLERLAVVAHLDLCRRKADAIVVETNDTNDNAAEIARNATAAMVRTVLMLPDGGGRGTPQGQLASDNDPNDPDETVDENQVREALVRLIQRSPETARQAVRTFCDSVQNIASS